ncbi:TonB family protein [Pseudodesulfovibrio cashew]|uniref:TonB family protein n=1 Tax=Pseudodesulfovibrio cashew TaxID=2678688 RepID=A0A6I6JL81_9BACT|nr:energy transducer TonB [Pseudodesulfovibrio cashew]QGY41738.1 TonB family protein [Pseudodesulfovibrio cashew]
MTWRTVAALLGAAGITLAVCLIIPMLGTVRHEQPRFEEHAVRVVPLPPETRQRKPEIATAPSGRVDLTAPTVPRTMAVLPAPSLPSDIALPALTGPESLSLTMPSAPAPGLAGPGIGKPGLPAFDKPPQLLTRLDPIYPLAARRSGTEGQVLVRVKVDESGHVIEADVIESEPAGVFDAAALHAIRGWRFSPAEKQGQPVAVIIDIPIRFTLDKP